MWLELKLKVRCLCLESFCDRLVTIAHFVYGKADFCWYAVTLFLDVHFELKTMNHDNCAKWS